MMSLLTCNDDDISISKDVQDFLNGVIDIMERNSIKRDKINWTDFRNKVLETAGTVQNSAQKLTGIKEALTLLGDNHSFLKTSSGNYVWGDYTLNCEAENTSPHVIPENIGYIQVFHFSGSSNSDAAIDFAQKIHDQISNSDDSNIIGWIVDLRGNGGGNMWPMLAGIGPILGEGIVGYFVDLDSRQTSWRYMNGSSFVNGNPITQLENPYELIIPNPKVAVLLDKEVGSSGEAIAISFIGRENTKSFGTATCGQSTANTGYKLSDNSTLYLAVAYMADRNLNLYGDQIFPDEEANAQNIIQKAVDWIEN